MQVTVFANELSLVPIKLWSYTHIAFAGKGSSLYDRTTTKAPLYTAKPSSLKCLVYEKVSPPTPLTHPVKSGKRLLETENTIIQLLVRLWWQGAPHLTQYNCFYTGLLNTSWVCLELDISLHIRLRKFPSTACFLYFYRFTVHSVVYLIAHTNTCTYIYYLRSLNLH